MRPVLNEWESVVHCVISLFLKLVQISWSTKSHTICPIFYKPPNNVTHNLSSPTVLVLPRPYTNNLKPRKSAPMVLYWFTWYKKLHERIGIWNWKHHKTALSTFFSLITTHFDQQMHGEIDNLRLVYTTKELAGEAASFSQSWNPPAVRWPDWYMFMR